MIIVDFSAIFFMNIYMTKRILKGKVEEDMLRHMVLNTIRGLNQRFRGEYGDMVLACDAIHSWRKDFFPLYKAKRANDRNDQTDMNWPDIFRFMTNMKTDLREHFPYIIIEHPRAEGDDVIAVIARTYAPIVDKVLIVSKDKDFSQLQTFPNVEQWDPILNKKLVVDDPVAYRIEHIIRGDKGDGIPNILSADDTFVTDKRQNKIKKDLIEQFYDCEVNGRTMPLDEDVASRLARNRTLIDFDFIPVEIVSEIQTMYSQYVRQPRSKIFDYLFDKSLRKLIGSVNDF